MNIKNVRRYTWEFSTEWGGGCGDLRWKKELQHEGQAILMKPQKVSTPKLDRSYRTLLHCGTNDGNWHVRMRVETGPNTPRINVGLRARST
jgi:hypothetical protein